MSLVGPIEAEAPPPPLYAAPPRIYPRAVKGRIRRVKWAVLIVLLGLYYVVPWLRFDRGPGLPDQAVLVDLGHARLFFFWIELWPQEVYFLTGVLVLAAIGLFAATSLYGRVWCGFTCPQTVWTDLFMLVERLVQGDRNARMKRDAQPSSLDRTLRKAATHAAWIAIAAATGGAWIMYFNDAPTVVRAIATGAASIEVYFFFGLFTLTTYVLAGFAREQVCTYMCPWPRFQGAMLDENSLVVTYRDWRGEPRGKPREAMSGDCVDCAACVNVCPTGVDIREGQQLGCIGCGLCIDACDDVMRKLDRPEGLIAFEALRNLAASQSATGGMPPSAKRFAIGMAARSAPRFFRPRTIMYAAVLGVVLAVMAGAFLMRETVSLSVLRDRAPLYVQLADGGLRNGFTIKLVNKTQARVAYSLTLRGLDGATLLVQQAALDGEGRPLLVSSPDGITEWRALVTIPAARRLTGSHPVVFEIRDPLGQAIATAQATLVGPAQ
ncbi:MAG: cytochrome c oxidase accessory protein CcoG [Pseudomonadota bacterium]